LQAADIDCKYDDDDDDDVYTTIVLNIDERFLFEWKQTPVENALFILLPHCTTTTKTVYRSRYGSEPAGLYYISLRVYIYWTRGRDRLFILDRLDIHPDLIRRISAAVATYILYIIYDISNVFSFPMDIIYIYIYYILMHGHAVRDVPTYNYLYILPGTNHSDRLRPSLLSRTTYMRLLQ